MPRLPDHMGLHLSLSSRDVEHRLPSSLTHESISGGEAPRLLAILRRDVLSSTHLLTASLRKSWEYLRLLSWELKVKYLLQIWQKYLCLFLFLGPRTVRVVLFITPFFLVLKPRQNGQRFFYHFNLLFQFNKVNRRLI